MSKVFICHASEDKIDFVRPLSQSLKKAGIEVWYDEFSLKPGDSLREKIDEGLMSCEKGIIVLSPDFIRKKWPQKELNALFARHIVEGDLIIPIWHNVNSSEVASYSPLIADIVAINSGEGTDLVLRKILNVLEPLSDYLIKDGAVVKANPVEFYLYQGRWKNKTPILIYNLGDTPAYNVLLKVGIEHPDIKSESIEVEYGGDRILVGRAGPIKVMPDIFIINGIDQDEREALYIYIHTVAPKESKQIIIAGTKPVESRAHIRVMDFQDHPSQIMEKHGKAGITFKTSSEAFKVKSIRIHLKRT